MSASSSTPSTPAEDKLEAERLQAEYFEHWLAGRVDGQNHD